MYNKYKLQYYVEKQECMKRLLGQENSTGHKLLGPASQVRHLTNFLSVLIKPGEDKDNNEKF
jgi:hypothetical protein